MSSAFTCRACERSYSSKGHLTEHQKRFPLCSKYNSLVGSEQFKSLFNNDWTVLMKESIDEKLDPTFGQPEDTGYKCKYCFKKFSNKGNVTKHMKNYKTCQKWEKVHKILDLTEELQIAEEQTQSTEKPAKYDDKKYATLKQLEEDGSESPENPIGLMENYGELENPPKDALIHIISNIFIVDKNTHIENKTVVKHNIGYVLAILPDENEYRKVMKDILYVPYSVMLYKDHKPTLDEDNFKLHCRTIHHYRNLKNNVMVFCNNGFQRSIPFLCYYLLKYYPGKTPNLSRALDLILPQIDNMNYVKNKKYYLENLKALFDPPKKFPDIAVV